MKVGRVPARNGGALLMRYMVFNSPLSQLIVTQVKVFPLGRIILEIRECLKNSGSSSRFPPKTTQQRVLR